MPVAVVVQNSEEFKLKSCEGGIVKIRRMTFGESLVRKDMMASVAMEMQGKSKGNESMKLQMDLLQEKTTLWEFKNLIVSHNLTDANEKLLDFSNPAHVKALEGRIGDEIQQYINELNSFEENEEVKN
jgi:hypothetical protein